MVAMRFTSTAVKDGRIWRVQCDQYPSAMSLVTRLADAAVHQQEAIAFIARMPQEEVDVDVRPQLPDGLDALVAEARSAVRGAEAAQRDAARMSRDAVAALKAAGLSGADVSVVLGVSPQRVSQLSRAG